MWPNDPGLVVEVHVTQYLFVEHLPDLIHPDNYPSDREGRLIRFRIRVAPNGIEVLGDAARAKTVEQVLESLGATVIEQMICG